MNIAHYISNWWKEVLEYKERVLKDGGTTKREDVVQQYNQMCKQNGIYNSIKFAWLGEAGYKQRTSGINTFWTKLFSLKTATPQARRNLLTYTEEFDNAVWSKTGATVTPNAVNSPIGTLSSDLLLEDSSTGNHQFSLNTGITDGVVKIRSIYLKKYNCRYIALGIASGNTSTTNTAMVDLDTKTIINIGSTILNVSIVPLQEDWVKVSWGSIFDSTFKNRFTIALSTGPTYVETSYTGTSTLGVYIWGAQLEDGSSPTSYQRVIDANSWEGVVIDATQTTSTNQPYLSGNIAPNEKWCLKNPNGGDEYMTHPTISFAANEAWSVTTVVNFSNPNGYYCGVINGSGLLLSNGYLAFTNNSSVSQNVTIQRNDITGKNTVLTTTANGDGQINSYINGIFVQQRALSSSLNFDSILRGRSNSFFGGIHAHIIRSQALTPSQVAAEANFLRSLYPEIPSVTIGSQVWATSNCEMVATPQGNLIANVTENANAEKITNAADREFSSDTGFWIKGTGVTISGGGANFTNVSGGVPLSLYKANLVTTDKWYKVVFDILNYSSGTVVIYAGGTLITYGSSNGTYTVYIKCGNTSGTFSFYSSATGNFTIDNVSVQEVGWSDSTNLYNYVYANTAGTDEQKTYAAVKAAGFWSYYNNDAALGAVYGKLYNWYAVKLLQMDIDYYNAANPSTPWGWRVPTDTDFNTLATTLGGASVAGGKMKKDGLVYWGSPNTGADNSSGFTALGSGQKLENGTLDALNVYAMYHCITETNSTQNKRAYITNTASNLYFTDVLKTRGHSIRLIKS